VTGGGISLLQKKKGGHPVSKRKKKIKRRPPVGRKIPPNNRGKRGNSPTFFSRGRNKNLGEIRYTSRKNQNR